MWEALTKSKARNIFYGGSLFFFLVFAGLTAHSHLYMLNTSTDGEGLTESVANGKRVWEKALMHQLPHDPWRGRLFCAGIGQCVGSLWWI